MKSTIPLLLVLGLALSAAEAEAQRRVQQTVAADPAGAVRIHNLAGRVTVSGWDRDSIAVEGTVPQAADAFHLGVHGAAAKLGVWGPEDGSVGEARLSVRVPAGSRVWIKTSTADVVVRDVRGGVDVASVSGSIDVRGAPAEAYLESLGGTVVAEVNTRMLRARTAGGDIEVRGYVDDAQAYTVSGRISIMNKQVGRGRFESVEGGIRYRGGVARGSSVEFITHDGDIDVWFPPTLDADIRVSSYRGSVENTLGGTLAPVPGRAGRGDTSMVLGNGGAEVVFRTFRGTVRLQRL